MTTALCEHAYSKAMGQSFPRKCTRCGQPEPFRVDKPNLMQAAMDAAQVTTVVLGRLESAEAVCKAARAAREEYEKTGNVSHGRAAMLEQALTAWIEAQPN